jgi:hypothetical protein
MTEEKKTVQTSEGGHFYKPNGEPAYTYKNKKGEEKATTLREARKEGWFPGVTTIIATQARFGLVNWMIDQAILSALTLPRPEGEGDLSFFARIKADAKEQARKAIEKGKIIHAWVQDSFEGKVSPPEADPFVISARMEITKKCGARNWICEKPFASPMGYGGKIDLQDPEIILDIKTTEKDLDTIRTWDDHAQQLAAYRTGVQNPNAKCGILYINVLTTDSKLLWLPEEELVKGFECFKALLAFWKAKNSIK